MVCICKKESNVRKQKEKVLVIGRQTEKGRRKGMGREGEGRKYVVRIGGSRAKEDIH